MQPRGDVGRHASVIGPPLPKMLRIIDQIHLGEM